MVVTCGVQVLVRNARIKANSYYTSNPCNCSHGFRFWLTAVKSNIDTEKLAVRTDRLTVGTQTEGGQITHRFYFLKYCTNITI